MGEGEGEDGRRGVVSYFLLLVYIRRSSKIVEGGSLFEWFNTLCRDCEFLPPLICPYRRMVLQGAIPAFVLILLSYLCVDIESVICRDRLPLVVTKWVLFHLLSLVC